MLGKLIYNPSFFIYIYIFTLFSLLVLIVLQTFWVSNTLKSRALLCLFSSNFAHTLQCGWQKTAIWCQMPPKVIYGSPMTKICKLYIFLGSKMPKIPRKLFCSQFPPKSFGVSNDQNLHFGGAKNCTHKMGTCFFSFCPVLQSGRLKHCWPQL